MTGPHHVEINVSDLERSVAFWGWLLPELGYELYHRRCGCQRTRRRI